MLPVTEGLLIAVLGTHLVLSVSVVWQIAQYLRRVELHIRRARRLVIGKMDCDELINKLMSIADPQCTGAGLAKGAPPAAAPQQCQIRHRGMNRCKNTANCLLPSRREAKPFAVWTDGPRENIHRQSTLWMTPKSRRCTPAMKPGWRWR